MSAPSRPHAALRRLPAALCRALSPLTLLAAGLLLAGCVSLPPARDDAQRVLLQIPANDLPRYTYPVRVVATPGYLQESAVYTADAKGNLTPLPGIRWAENPANSLQRSLSLLLGSAQPPPAGTELRIRIDRFLLLDDGSAEAVLSLRKITPQQNTPLPLVQTRLPNAWNPAQPSTAPAGYQSLLQSLPPQIQP